MKNLKQVLALGMAFSLTMSSMAGAAFTDSADIKATEAVNMLSALGVIKGYEDGSFKPEGTVTRAEAAKMIFTIRNGGNDDASAWAGTATSFTDLAGYGWAEGYIKYCQSMGIIAGKSATSFDPGAQVTGVELAKMVLVTLGYNAETAGLTGATWANKTLGLAGENGLLDDVSSNLAAGLPRQYAAQLLYNGVNADVVTYENGQYQKVETTKTEWVTSPDGKTTQAVQVTTNKTLGNVYMSLETTAVTLNSVSYDSAKNTYTLNTTGGSYTKVTEDYSELVGQKVNVLHKKGANDAVYGVYADEDVTVVETVAGKLDKVTSKTDAIKVDGKEYKTNGAITGVLVYEFNSSVGMTDKDDADKYAYDKAKNLDELVDLTDSDAYTVKLIDNDGDSKIDLAVVYPFAVTEVTYVGSTSVTVKNSDYGNKELSEITVYDGIAKDDIVKVSATTNTGDKKYKYEKLEVVTGEVTATRDSGKEGQINGNWYKVASNPIEAITFKAGEKVDIAVVGEYAYSYKISESSATVDNLVYVDQTAWTTGIDKGFSAKVYFADGTYKTVTISKIDGDKVVSGAASSGEVKVSDGEKDNTVYTYTMDGDKYELKKLSDTKGEENKLGYKGIANVTSGASAYEKKLLTTDKGSVKIADDAVLFLESKAGEGDVKVVTGKDVNAWGDSAINLTSGQVAYSESNGFMYAKAGCLVINSDIPAASGDMSYGYLTDAPSEIKVDNTTYIQFNVWTKDGAKTVRAKTAEIKTAGIEKGDFIKYNSGDGTTVTDVNEITTSGAVTAYAGGTEIVVKNENGSDINDSFENKLADDATIVYVDTKNTKGIEGGSIQLASDAEADKYKIANVMYVLSSDNKKIVALFVDTNNDLDKVANAVKAEDVSDELNKSDNVTIGGNLTVSSSLTIKEGKTLTVNGDLTVDVSKARAASQLVVEGKLVVTGTLTIKDGVTVSVGKDASVEAKKISTHDDGLVGEGADTNVKQDGEVYKVGGDALATKVTL